MQGRMKVTGSMAVRRWPCCRRPAAPSVPRPAAPDRRAHRRDLSVRAVRSAPAVPEPDPPSNGRWIDPGALQQDQGDHHADEHDQQRRPGRAGPGPRRPASATGRRLPPLGVLAPATTRVTVRRPAGPWCRTAKAVIRRESSRDRHRGGGTGRCRRRLDADQGTGVDPGRAASWRCRRRGHQDPRLLSALELPVDPASRGSRRRPTARRRGRTPRPRAGPGPLARRRMTPIPSSAKRTASMATGSFPAVSRSRRPSRRTGRGAGARGAAVTGARHPAFRLVSLGHGNSHRWPSGYRRPGAGRGSLGPGCRSVAARHGADRGQSRAWRRGAAGSRSA